MSKDSRIRYLVLACIISVTLVAIVALQTNSTQGRLPSVTTLFYENPEPHVKSLPEGRKLTAERADVLPTGVSNSGGSLPTISGLLEQKMSRLERDYQFPYDLKKFIGPSASPVMRKDLRGRINSHLSERLSISDLRLLAHEVTFSTSSLELLERAYLKQNYTSSAQDLGNALSRFELLTLEQLISQSIASHQDSQVIDADSDAHLINELSHNFSFSLAHFLSTKYLAL